MATSPFSVPLSGSAFTANLHFTLHVCRRGGVVPGGACGSWCGSCRGPRFGALHRPIPVRCRDDDGGLVGRRAGGGRFEDSGRNVCGDSLSLSVSSASSAAWALALALCVLSFVPPGIHSTPGCGTVGHASPVIWHASAVCDRCGMRHLIINQKSSPVWHSSPIRRMRVY